MKQCFTCFLLILSTYVFAQSGKIQGILSSSDSQPASSVNVVLKGTGKGSVTDPNGYFEINGIAPGKYTLVVSFLGLANYAEIIQIEADKTSEVAVVLKESAQQLNEVVVTASSQKYKESLPSQGLRISTPILETAQNIQVINKSLLYDQQIFDMLEGVQRNISGAQKVEHWDNYARINMRGSQLTPFRNGMNVKLSAWSPLTEDMSMVERIEFVKGPAGFMLANGEPGGFYNVVTKKPSGKEKGEVTFTLGSYEHYRVTTDLDGKLDKNGKLLYRLNLMGQLKGSHREFEFNNRYSIAPVLKYLINENSALTLEYNEQYSQMSVVGSNYSFSRRGYADLPASFTMAEPNLEPTVMRDKNISLLLDHRFNEHWKLTAQLAYLHFKQVGQSLWPLGMSTDNDSLMHRGISIWDAFGVNKNGQIYINGDFNTGSVDHHILMGVDMSHKDYFADWNQGAELGGADFNIYQPIYGQLTAAQIPQWDRSRSIRERAVRYNNSYTGFYIQDEMSFFHNMLRLTLAGRYTTNTYQNPYEGTTKDGKFTPRIGLSWSVSSSTAIYGVIDQVFLANPGTDWQGANFDPITGVSREVGIKKDWYDGRWNTAISAYQITRNNVLTTDVDHPDPTTSQLIYNRQTGQQKTKGLEFDVKGELVKGLELVLNYAYTDARITKDSDETVIGNAVAGATKHLQNTWLSYKVQRGTLTGLRLSLGYQYQAGRSSWFVFDNSENALPDYFRLDGGVGYQTGKLSINLLFNNLLDKYLYSGAPNYDGTFYWQAEAPRNYRVSVGYRF